MQVTRSIFALLGFSLHAYLFVKGYTINSAIHPQPLELTLIREGNELCTLISLTETQRHRLLLNHSDVITEITPLLSTEDPQTSEKLQLIGYTAATLWTRAKTLCLDLTNQKTQGELFHVSQHSQRLLSMPSHQLEVYPLVVSGPSSNRVDIPFFSDGYTINERDKFLADAKRLALDISQNQTFATVQPLLNFWAAFAPSSQSGIGVNGTPKNTTFGLYRDGTELRAVYCSKKGVARDACLSLRSRCDFPILLGNDPLYGGLGGEFTISTASEINGPLVLRHELGHSILGVGEEYDGGFAYFGVNAAQSISQNTSFPWSHWLSSAVPGRSLREERAIMPFQAYPWTILNDTSPWSTTFASSGLYSSHLVRFSLSGVQHDLQVRLDGKNLAWEPRPGVGPDRWHYDIHRAESLTMGTHELSFTLDANGNQSTAQLCSTEIIEYGDEKQFNSTPGFYGAFPTFSDKNLTTFRPTNEFCLMRIVTSPSFCNVCLEQLWLSLLKRVSLIEEFSVTTGSPDKQLASITMELTLLSFGELRKLGSHRSAGEVYVITWNKDGKPLPSLENLTKIALDTDVQGVWRVNVRLHTEEIRADPNGLLEQSAQVEIGDGRVSEPQVLD